MPPFTLLARLGSLLRKRDPANPAPPQNPSHPSIELAFGDLLAQGAQAVANASDWTMLGGTGVDGAIHEAAGPALGAWIAKERCRLSTAGVVCTPGFNLAAKAIVHTCAPTWDPSDREEGMRALALCHFNCVMAADRAGMESIALPLLGAGAFCWPSALAAQAMATGLRQAAPHCASLRWIRACAFRAPEFEALREALGIPGSIDPGAGGGAYHAGASALSGLSAEQIENYFKA